MKLQGLQGYKNRVRKLILAKILASGFVRIQTSELLITLAFVAPVDQSLISCGHAPCTQSPTASAVGDEPDCHGLVLCEKNII